MTSASAPGSQSHKERRYDRQLRLWGEHGQAAMEECSVCLINGSAVGAEALKNLVLPGARRTAQGAAARLGVV